MTELAKRVYYSLAVWRFKPILSAGLRFHSHLSGGLRLRNYRAVAGNHKFTSRFSVFTCFYGGFSNRVKRHRRLSGNFITRDDVVSQRRKFGGAFLSCSWESKIALCF